MWFSVVQVKFHWFGINWYVFNQSEYRNCYYHSENRATSQIWKILPNMVFPSIWGKKMAAFWACACKLSWTLLSPARVQPLYGVGRKESSGTGLHRTELQRPDGPPSGAPYPYKEIKETHELNFSCYRGQRYFSWARTHDDGGDGGVAQHGGHTSKYIDLGHPKSGAPVARLG